MPYREDDTELVRLAAKCDDKAFAALCRRHRALLHSVAARFSPDRDDRQDLQSDVIAKLLENDKHALRSWRPVAPFFAYLTTIATRHCLLTTQREGRLRTVPIAPLRAADGESVDVIDRLLPTDPDDEPEATLERREAERALTRAVGELDPADRLVLSMRFHDGMDGPTMASVLGITHGAVRQRVFKAVRRLETILRRSCPELFVEPESKNSC